MTISSRTPEGSPNHCPICRSDVCIEPSVLFGDATCPNCGSLLWFLNVESATRIYDRFASRSIRDRVIALIAEQLGVAPETIAENSSLVNDFRADSLDTAELVMELEDEFGLP